MTNITEQSEGFNNPAVTPDSENCKSDVSATSNDDVNEMQELFADLEYAHGRVLNSTNLIYLADVAKREIKESTVSEMLNADSLAHDMVDEAQQLCRLLHDKLTRHKVYWQNKVAILEATIAELEAN